MFSLGTRGRRRRRLIAWRRRRGSALTWRRRWRRRRGTSGELLDQGCEVISRRCRRCRRCPEAWGRAITTRISTICGWGARGLLPRRCARWSSTSISALSTGGLVPRRGTGRGRAVAIVLTAPVVAITTVVVMVPLTSISSPGRRTTRASSTPTIVMVAVVVAGAPGSRATCRSTLPWFGVAVAVGARAGFDASGSCSAAELRHELLVTLSISVARMLTPRFFWTMTYLVVGVVFSASADPSLGPWAIIAPACTSLPIRTVAGHMACVATHSADDAGSKVLLLRAIVLAVSYLATILASLVFIITQGSVQSSELTELVTLQFVLALGNRSSLWVSVFGQ